jgi:acetyl esterase/lipase
MLKPILFCIQRLMTVMMGFAASCYAQDPISLQAYLAMTRPEPAAQISYGSAASQAADVFLPAGPGPFPVVVLIHGGCWRDFPGAGRQQMRMLGAELAELGVAVWSIGYRRADEAGGGYPGTYQDVGTAIDSLRLHAEKYRLDLSRTVLVGHSAGGHLALWAASRKALPSNSPLSMPQPFVPTKVVSLAGIGDLKTFAPTINTICGPGIAESITGARAQAGRDLFADISPAQMSGAKPDVVMVSGVLDRLVPPYAAHDYALAKREDIAVKLVNVPNAGHFDLVTPGRAGWMLARNYIEAALSP